MLSEERLSKSYTKASRAYAQSWHRHKPRALRSQNGIFLTAAAYSLLTAATRLPFEVRSGYKKQSFRIQLQVNCNDLNTATV